MKRTDYTLEEMLASVPKEIREEVNLEFDVSNRVYQLMQAKGISKKELADALGKRPSEITKWLSGQHNFTLRTIAMLTAFFGQTIIQTIK
ncbi:MAG: helix-turn-helix transcriptional regulator [Bacteroidales bacterium]|nr:helix-turn-helix transcriptional regulator [Bacteroidales bacterium]